MFENIIGYDYVKEELNTIINWYRNDCFLNNENAKLPSGILFYGRPGNGKTLFIKELKDVFKDSAFVITGDTDNILNEVTSIYKNARDKKRAIVLIDEIDLLLKNDSKMIRILQDELDGINNSTERILTIATTNHYRELPDALLRNGRFDRIIKIDYPNANDRKLIINHYFCKLGIEYEFLDEEYIIDYLSYLSCSDLMTLCNDCYFRYNGEIINEDKITNSLLKLDPYGSCFDEGKKTIEVAYHEIGHALITLKYNKYFSLREVKFVDTGGMCKNYKNDDSFDGMNLLVKDIEVTLGGAAAEKVLFNDVGRGSEDDLEEARNKINYLVNRFPYHRINGVLKRFDPNVRTETERTRYKNEKIANKLFVKCYKRTYKYLKKHKKEIIKYGNILYEKGCLLKGDFENEI